MSDRVTIWARFVATWAVLPECANQFEYETILLLYGAVW